MAGIKWHNDLNDLARFIENDLGATIANNADLALKLKKAANDLTELLKFYIMKYYASYEPKEYIRTYNWIDSIQVSPSPKINGNFMWMEIQFDPELAFHPSYISPSQPDGYVPWLMEVGWDITEKVQPPRYRFTHFEGTHYIKDAVDDFNRMDYYGFKVAVWYKDGDSMIKYL